MSPGLFNLFREEGKCKGFRAKGVYSILEEEGVLGR